MMSSGRRGVPVLCAAALLLSLWGAVPADAKLDAKAWKAAKAEFETLFAERGDGEKKIAVLETVVSDGSARAWKLLLQAFPAQVERVQTIGSEYAQAAAVHGDILLGTLKGYSPDQEDRAKDLQKRMAGLEEAAAEERRVLDALLGAYVGAPSSPRKAVLKLAKGKAPWSLRAAVAHVAASSLADRSSLSHVKRVLEDDPDKRVRAATLAAMAAAKALPKKACSLAVEHLTSDNPELLRRAALVVAAHPCASACEPLRKAWASAPWKVRQALGAAVEALLADAALAAPSADLKAWWDALPKRAPQAHIATIPLVGDGVLFVVDVSTYMKPRLKDSSWKLAPARKGAKSAPEQFGIEGTLLEVARHELELAIRKLPESTHFNVLAFNHGAGLWQRSMKPATKTNKNDARKWLRALRPSGAAFVSGALRLTFRAAGAFALGGAADMPQIDTLVLVSAGKTTDNAFPTHRPVEPGGVLERIRGWNRTLRLVIHTVALGKSEFLEDLAAQHGGVCAHR